MTNTRIKLEEAKYFLKRTAEEVANRETFKYNLSAFLSAGRSVTFIMQTEFSNVRGFKEWYDEKQKQLGRNSLMKLINNKRVMTIHKKPIHPRAHIEIKIEGSVQITDQLVMISDKNNGTVERTEFKEESLSVPKPK